jgi:hypothetical protein
MGNQNKFSALNMNTKNTGGNKSGSKNSPMNNSANAKKTVPAKMSKDLKVETATASSKETTASATAGSLLPGHDGEVDANTVKRIIAAHNEYYGNDLIDEVCFFTPLPLLLTLPSTTSLSSSASSSLLIAFSSLFQLFYALFRSLTS